MGPFSVDGGGLEGQLDEEVALAGITKKLEDSKKQVAMQQFIAKAVELRSKISYHTTAAIISLCAAGSSGAWVIADKENEIPLVVAFAGLSVFAIYNALQGGIAKQEYRILRAETIRETGLAEFQLGLVEKRYK